MLQFDINNDYDVLLLYYYYYYDTVCLFAHYYATRNLPNGACLGYLPVLPILMDDAGTLGTLI